MAGAKNTQQSSRLVTLEPYTLLTVSILITVFYVDPNAGRSIDDLVADNLRVNEGESAVLSCFFSPSNAVIGKWYWKTNGTVIIRSDDKPNPNSRYSLGDAASGNVSLVIKEVLRWDKGTYTCGVNDQSTGSTVPHADDSKLTVNYLDKPNLQALTDTRIPEGTRVSMSCKVMSSFPEVSLLTWFHEGDVIDSASGKYIVYDEIFEIKKIDQRDAGNYSCRAENEYFVGKNGKYSNSITFSLKKKEAIPPPSPSSSPIWIVFIIIPVPIIGGIALAMYFWKKRSENKHRFDDFINQNVMKKGQKNEINVERALEDFIPAEFAVNGHEEALKFENEEALIVKRGECITASFKSTYVSTLECFQERVGCHDPFFTMLLLSCNWPEQKKLHQLYSSDKTGDKRKTGNYDASGSHGSIQFRFKFKKNVKYGVTGYIIFNNVTDDDEGQYIYSLQIKEEFLKCSFRPKIKKTFYGRTSVQLPNVVYRSNVVKKQFISPIGIVVSDQVYVFALNTEKEENEGQEDNTTLRYITCAGKPQLEKDITITWSAVAKILLKPEEKLLSFVALPGLIHSYIFLGYVNVSKDRRLLGEVFSFLSDGSYKFTNTIIEALNSGTEGRVEDLTFDPHSGKKLSNRRLVVGGWIKRGYQKRKRMDALKLRYTRSASSIDKLEDVENQSYEYEPFIMWTDDEINWNLGENLKIKRAVENMRIQVTETGKEVVVIISSLDSRKVLYEGQSNDYCTTFTEKTKNWQFGMPIGSFTISNGSLVCTSSIECVNETSGQQDAQTAANKGEVSSENTRKEKETDKPATNEMETLILEKPSEESVEESFNIAQKPSMFRKAANLLTNALSYSSRESSANASIQKYQSVSTIEVSSVNNGKSMENTIKEGSPEANELTDDEIVSTLEKSPEDSMEGTSEKIKKRSSLGKLGRVLTDRFSFSSKKPSSDNEQTKEAEGVSPTEKSTFIKESAENTIKEGSSETNKLKEDEQVKVKMVEPPEDSMEPSEKVKKRSSLSRLAKKATTILPLKSKRELSESKLTRESETSEILTPNFKESLSQIQDKITWEGLWHLEQDTSTDTAIRLRPVKHDTEYSDSPNDFVTILENRSKVQCEQIVPFTCKGKSWFLMIYTTHFKKDKEDEQNHSLCTRYHVFSLDKIMSRK